MLYFYYKVINSTATDEFLSVSNTALFSDGVSSTIGTLVLINDALPEGNETFVVEIVDARFGAELGSLTTLLLTVEASDEPNGRISFDEVSIIIIIKTLTSPYEIFLNKGVTLSN